MTRQSGRLVKNFLSNDAFTDAEFQLSSFTFSLSTPLLSIERSLNTSVARPDLRYMPFHFKIENMIQSDELFKYCIPMYLHR